MKKNIKKRWIKALRSGEYEQGKGRLKDEEGKYCCLGVLCDITKKETGGRWSSDGYFMKQGSKGSDGVLPLFVMNHTGIKTHEGLLNKEYKTKLGSRDLLTLLNDEGLSFKQIANIIDKNF